MESTPIEMTDAYLIAKLREVASHWFNNTQLLLLEELIRRYNALTSKSPIE